MEYLEALRNAHCCYKKAVHDVLLFNRDLDQLPNYEIIEKAAYELQLAILVFFVVDPGKNKLKQCLISFKNAPYIGLQILKHLQDQPLNDKDLRAIEKYKSHLNNMGIAKTDC